MKSIRYSLFHSPQNRDDCVDLSRKSRLLAVRLTLATSRFTADFHTYEHLVGRYSWHLPNHTVRYDETYGWHLLDDSPERKRNSIDSANLRPEKALELLEARGIDVLGKEERFNYSLIQD